MDWLCQFESCN
jgi:hypothetical protein